MGQGDSSSGMVISGPGRPSGPAQGADVGVRVEVGSPLISRNRIDENGTQWSGGGVSVIEGEAEIDTGQEGSVSW